jgi:hypothetical protein
LINWDLSPFNRLPFGPVLTAFFFFLGASFRSRAALQLEILALRHQIGVLQRSVKRPKLSPADRFLWAWLSSIWNGWESRVSIVKVATVIGWHRKGFGMFWSWKIRHGKLGRPAVPKEVRALIRLLSRENPLWGAPHIHGELLKLGINIGETSVSKYMVRHRKPPSQTWRTFLDNLSLASSRTWIGGTGRMVEGAEQLQVATVHHVEEQHAIGSRTVLRAKNEQVGREFHSALGIAGCFIEVGNDAVVRVGEIQREVDFAEQFFVGAGGAEGVATKHVLMAGDFDASNSGAARRGYPQGQGHVHEYLVAIVLTCRLNGMQAELLYPPVGDFADVNLIGVAAVDLMHGAELFEQLPRLAELA